MEDACNYPVMCGGVILTFTLLLLFHPWRMIMTTNNTKLSIPIHTKLTYYNKFATTNSIIAKFIIPLLMLFAVTLSTPTQSYLIPTLYDTCKANRNANATAVMGSLQQNNTINVRFLSLVFELYLLIPN
jgi:hypothetical protein